MSLCIQLDQNYFNRFRDHVDKNMFFSIKRLAARYNKLLLCSVGDHLSNSGEPNYAKADISVEVKLANELSIDDFNMLEVANSWVVLLSHNKESYAFIIDRETEFIQSRIYCSDTTV